MASPHVAGVAALILDQFPTYTVSQVKTELTNRATTGKVGNPGTGSPNLLLYAIGSAPPPPGPPAAPTLNVFSEYCYGLNTVTWTAPTGATTYELWRSYSSSFTSPTLVYSGTSRTQFVNVTGNTYYRAKACNSYGCSAYSNQGTATYHQGECL